MRGTQNKTETKADAQQRSVVNESTVIVGEVEQHSYHGPHAVLHCLAHVTEAAVGQHRARQRQRAVVQRPAVPLDHFLTVPQSSNESDKDILIRRGMGRSWDK